MGGCLRETAVIGAAACAPLGSPPVSLAVAACRASDAELGEPNELSEAELPAAPPALRLVTAAVCKRRCG